MCIRDRGYLLLRHGGEQLLPVGVELIGVIVGMGIKQSHQDHLEANLFQQFLSYPFFIGKATKFMINVPGFRENRSDRVMSYGTRQPGDRQMLLERCV